MEEHIRTKYLDGLFSDASVPPGDDDDFPGQVRNVGNGKLGLWGEVGIENRKNDLPEDFECTRVGHAWV